MSYLKEAKITIVCAETSSVSFSRPNHLVLSSVTVALLLPARAQQLAMPTIGFLYSQSRKAIEDRVAAFITASRKQALSKAKTSRSNTAGVFIAVLGCPANPFVDKGGICRCHLVLEPKLVLVERRPWRAFQGRRYLPSKDCPRDLDRVAPSAKNMPETFRRELRELGLP